MDLEQLKIQFQEYAKCAKDPIYFLNTYGYVFDISKNKVDRLSLFEYQKEVIEKYKNHKNNIILKSRQCLPENTFVDTPNGPKPIQDFKEGDLIYSYNFQTSKIEIDTIRESWYSGERQCVKVKLNDSRVIETGENHPFWSVNKNKWVTAKELSFDDEILDTNTKFDKTNPRVISVEQSEIKKCYDISVTKNENFLVDGLLVQNTGISVVTAAFVVWKLLFHIDEKILIISNKAEGAIRFLESVRQFIDYLPQFLLPDKIIKSNTRLIELSNGSWIKATASSETAGRGETLTMLILDETAFIENAEQIWMSAGLALSSENSKCVMLSTPCGTGGLYHSTWVGSKKGENDFIRTEVHWTGHPFYSKGITTAIDEQGKSYKTSPWYEKQREKFQYNKVKIAQELDLSFEGSQATVIENHIIESYEKEIIGKKPLCYYDWKQPGIGFVDYQTTFYVWEKPTGKGNFIISADVGRGDGSDFSTIQVIDADHFSQVAEYQGKIPPDTFAEIIQKVAKEYNYAFVAIECNSFGLATCLTLKNVLKYDKDKIYHSKAALKKMINRTHGYIANEGDDIPGFQTTTKTRPLLISCLGKHMREGMIKINSSRLLDEFRTFIFIDDEAQHANGYHDDLIFAFAIGLLVRETEYENVFTNNKFTKAMLDAISIRTTTFNEKMHTVEQGNKLKEQQDNQSQYNPHTGRVNTGNYNNENLNDDLSWLYAPIKK